MYVKEGNSADREECCSLRCIRDKMYILSPKQQSMMNQIKNSKNEVVTERDLAGKTNWKFASSNETVMRKEMLNSNGNQSL
ncbi:hypothetical protein TNCV_4476611 [Trichonephila clavipes]|nr:hypothetical protein TNCV_4476611 [Trichonephila clavipes]